MGLYMSDQLFSGGDISASLRFHKTISPATCCDFVIWFDPATNSTLDVGVPNFSFDLFAFREFRSEVAGGQKAQWFPFAGVGNRDQGLLADVDYPLRVRRSGSKLQLFHNDVLVLDRTLPKTYGRSQVGLLCIGEGEIILDGFVIKPERPKAFVIMQFSTPFNEVYMEVIKEVCNELEVDVIRLDEAAGPGLIISDITREIVQCTFVIADITPVNANVFYEVGYAHGLNKPAILIAEKGTILPFDVSPFRTLFYENSIAGKSSLEVGLKKYINAVLNEGS